MKMCKYRNTIIIGLSVFILFGYWSGFGHFVVNNTFLSGHMTLEQTSITVIDQIKTTFSELLSNLAQVDNSSINSDKTRPASTNVDNRANNTNKLEPVSTKLDFRTIKPINSGPASINIGNITTVVYTSHHEPITVTAITTPSSTHPTSTSTTPSSTHPTSTSSKTTANLTDSQNKTLYITAMYFTMGRLGNQMFRYASLLGIARAQGRKLIIPPGSDLQNTFKIRHVESVNDSFGWLYMTEAGAYDFDPKLMKLPLQNMKLNGYFQVIPYFKDIEDEVRQDFTFRDNIANDAASILNVIKTKYGPSMMVGVHVRRGDFLTGKKAGYIVPDKSYFVNAFNWMKSNFSGRNITFLIASDDLKWCNDNLIGNGIIVIPQASPAVHLAVLASCDHVIISSGSFGWWSGWLAEGKVIYYKEFMRNDTSIGRTFNAKTYYPPLWMAMGD